MKKLSDICHINPRIDSNIPDKTNVSFIPMRSVSKEGDIDVSQVRKFKEVRKGFTFFRDGDVLFAKITPCMENGKGTIAKNLKNGIGFGSTEFHVLRPRNKEAKSEWIYYLLYSKQFRLIAARNMTGTAGQKRVSSSYLENFKIPVPSVSIQRKIISTLEKTDTLRQKRKEQLNLLDDYLKSVFFDIFGDPHVNPNNFPIKELKELYCDDKNGTKCGPFGSALKKHEYTAEGIPVWNMDNISLQGQMIPNVNLFIPREKYDQLKTYSIQNGDVIISRAGTVGKMCVLQSPFEESIISTNLIRVRFNTELLPQFFVALMTYCKGRVGRLKTGVDGSFTHMNTGILDKLKFPYPPIKLQKKFDVIVEQVEQTKQKMRASLDEMDNHFNALVQRYFG